VIVFPTLKHDVAALVMVLRPSSIAPAGITGATGLDDAAVPDATPNSGSEARATVVAGSPFSPALWCLVQAMSMRDRPAPGAIGTVLPTPVVPMMVSPSLPYRATPSEGPRVATNHAGP